MHLMYFVVRVSLKWILRSVCNAMFWFVVTALFCIPALITGSFTDFAAMASF